MSIRGYPDSLWLSKASRVDECEAYAPNKMVESANVLALHALVTAWNKVAFKNKASLNYDGSYYRITIGRGNIVCKHDAAEAVKEFKTYLTRKCEFFEKNTATLRAALEAGSDG